MKVTPPTENKNTVELPPEDLLYLQKLELNRLSFERKLNEELEIEEPTLFKIINNDTAEYRTMDDHCLLATVQWDLIALYHPLIIPNNDDMEDNEGAKTVYQWSWSWGMIQPEPGSTPDVVRKVIQDSKIPKDFTRPEVIHFKDEILISYLMARVADILKYPYIHIMNNGNGSFSAFGVRNVQWADYNAEAHKAQLYYSVIAFAKQ